MTCFDGCSVGHLWQRTFYITGLDEQQSLHKISENIFMDGWMDGWMDLDVFFLAVLNWTLDQWQLFPNSLAVHDSSQQYSDVFCSGQCLVSVLTHSIEHITFHINIMWNSRKHPNLQLFTKLCIPTNTGLPSAFSSKESCFITHSYSLLQPNYCITTRSSKECISVSYNWSSERMFFI